MSKPVTIQEIFAKKPTTGTANFIIDSELAEEWHAAELLVESLRFSDDKKAVQEASDALEDLRPQVEDATRVWSFKSLGRRGYRELVQEHKPTKAQKREARDEGRAEPVWNEDTFPPALLAETAVEPQLTIEQAEELWDSDDYNAAELDLLFMTALNINARTRVMSLGKESGRTSG